jgi:hypothetical protein
VEGVVERCNMEMGPAQKRVGQGVDKEAEEAEKGKSGNYFGRWDGWEGWVDGASKQQAGEYSPRVTYYRAGSQSQTISHLVLRHVMASPILHQPVHPLIRPFIPSTNHIRNMRR